MCVGYIEELISVLYRQLQPVENVYKLSNLDMISTEVVSRWCEPCVNM